MTDRDLYIWIGIVGLMVVTVLTRSALVVLSRDIELPQRLQRALRYAPMAALMAIIVPSIFISQGEISATLVNPRLWAALTSLAVFGFTRQMVPTIVSGLLVFLAFQLY